MENYRNKIVIKPEDIIKNMMEPNSKETIKVNSNIKIKRINSIEDFSNINELFFSNSNIEEDPIENNKMVCRLIKLHFPRIYDYIYIPFSFFKNEEWNIHKLIIDNKDALFYHPLYLSTESKRLFDDVFDRYTIMVEELFYSNNLFIRYLKKWTDTESYTIKLDGRMPLLKSFILSKKYKYVSPLFITKIYSDLVKDKDKNIDVKKEMIDILDSTIKIARRIIADFRKKFEISITYYILHSPIDREEEKEFAKNFRNDIMILILNTIQSLIDNNIYAIHYIMGNIIEDDLMIDSAISHNPLEYGGRKIITV